MENTLPEGLTDDSEKENILTESSPEAAGEAARPEQTAEEIPESPEIEVSLEDIISEIKALPDTEPPELPKTDKEKRRISLFFIIPALLAIAMILSALGYMAVRRVAEDHEPERSTQTPEPVTTQALPSPSRHTAVYIPSIIKPGHQEPEAEDAAEVIEKPPLFWGIDVSEHQLDIDWQAAALTGLDFAMIRVGYRGYTYGDIYEDEYFKANIKGASENDVSIGVYFFSQATTPQEAVEEAEYVLKKIRNYDVTYPVVFDWEYMAGDTSRTADMTFDRVTECATAFCETIAEAGYIPMVYFSQSAAILHFELERLTQYNFWLADYSDEPYFYYDYQMWQYTASGTLAGISTDVDKNYCFTDYESLAQEESAPPEVTVTFQGTEN